MSPRITLASERGVERRHLNAVLAQAAAPRSSIQCHAVCATNADRMIVPIRSATTCLNTSASAGTASASTNSCPSSTPTLNETSDVARWRPGELHRLAQREREAEAVHEPEAERDQPRVARAWRPTMFSSAMYTIDSAISTSISGGNQSASGAKPERRRDQRDRVRDGERRDDRDERPDLPERNDEAEDEQQVVDAVEDVRRSRA